MYASFHTLLATIFLFYLHMSQKTMSCQGCRVLRKGCSEDCVLKPCLKWIETPQSQANATLFLAKFYGRAGLVNLISSAPEHLHPDIFKSLLYEACGRIINPVYGGVGLMWTGNWQDCQAAVEAVLKGNPIFQVPLINEAYDGCPQPIMPLQFSGIRHAAAKKNSTNVVVNRTRTRKNRNNLRYSSKGAKMVKEEVEEWMHESTKFSITGWELNNTNEELTRVCSKGSFSVESYDEPCLVDFYVPYNKASNFEIIGTSTSSSSKTNEVSLELKLTLPIPQCN